MALRRALAGKERTLDSISVECRRLEDAIEDEHMTAERLRQELERKESVLSAERDAAAELERDFRDLRVRLLKRRRHGINGPALADSTYGTLGYVLTFVVGMGAGLAIAFAVVIGSMGVDGFRRAFFGPRAVAQAVVPASPASGAEPNGVGEMIPATGAHPAASVQTREPVVLRTVRDPLSDGSKGPPMVVLPAGSFAMGSAGLAGERDEHPEHQVQLGGFLIGAHEVTFGDFDRFVRATGRRSPDDFGWGRGRRPVVDVSWEDARAYAQWLSRQSGRRYRLPSEAEWEYAARGGTTSPYWWGLTPEVERARCFDCGTKWDAGHSTAPVGSFEPNPYGLYDTAGNALEWTADCYRPSYEGAPADGKAWDWEPCNARVVRGGAFNKPATSMRSAARSPLAPDTRINMLGFRLARDV